MKIQYDPFCLRQFKEDYSGTKLDIKITNDLISEINVAYDRLNMSFIKLENSDNDFCKYLIIENMFQEIKASTIKLDLTTYPYVETEYIARTEDELPVLTRYVRLPNDFEIPMAKYLVIILYSREQLEKEHKSKSELPFYLDENVEYGIVAILGTEKQEADPMVPITQFRNALGIEHGGNGVSLNREYYLKSVEFWKNNILIK